MILAWRTTALEAVITPGMHQGQELHPTRTAETKEGEGMTSRDLRGRRRGAKGTTAPALTDPMKKNGGKGARIRTETTRPDREVMTTGKHLK